jgi:hypothetical protein
MRRMGQPPFFPSPRCSACMKVPALVLLPRTSRAFRNFVQSVGGIGPAPAGATRCTQGGSPPVLVLEPPELQLAHESI